MSDQVNCWMCGAKCHSNPEGYQKGLCRKCYVDTKPVTPAPETKRATCEVCGFQWVYQNRSAAPKYCLQHTNNRARKKRLSVWIPPYGVGTCAWCGDWFGKALPMQTACPGYCTARIVKSRRQQRLTVYERTCAGCGVSFKTTDQRKLFHKAACGKSRLKPQTNVWLLANKPHLPTEPCRNCGKPVAQYRNRRYEMEARYCSPECRPHALLSLADWPPKTYGRSSAVRSGCLDCNTRQAGGRCKRHGDKRELLLKQLRTRINWLLPRACLNCSKEFNRFDQGGVCDACHAKVRSAQRAKRRARIAGALRKDKGICHQELHRIFNGTCQLCGNKTQPPEVWIGWDGKTAMPYAPTVDHIIPLAKAGTHTWDNVQLAHALCNSFKNAS